MAGHKRADDKAATLGWSRWKMAHSLLCRCGHPEWQHMGLDEPACTHLGACPCTRFRLALEKTA